MSGFAALAGISIADGAAVVVLDGRHVGEPPVAHGGVAMTLLEAACESLAGPGAVCVSFKVQLVGPARRGETVTARAVEVRRTRTLAFVEAAAATGVGDIARASAVYSL